MAELQARFGDKVECKVHRGDRGVFDVLVDGQRIFSKDELGRFPKRGEVVDLIAPRLGGKSR
ncbi:selT/selW/selH selenoprotein domain-containing protein [Nannocystis exedens]|uniref:SelT/selW/selH selenoprotein domain-containing protein n=1 Tax=Nannocystis exedens TaxID=54 RepID=A0A1I2A6S3_9BACT|nr:Rdx family protein [Nannocystis exedens]SFE39536.1 selT/selW/selH selenoprotein domain-containing protein [Nannocystis exedens]